MKKDNILAKDLTKEKIKKDLTINSNRGGFIILTLIFCVALTIFLISTVSAYTRSAPAYTFGHQTGDYRGSGNLLPTFNQNMCGAGQDFILQVDPLGCTPSVVRSDLLEEQEVSVLCPVYATQLNPLIDIDKINYITISSRNLPKEVLTVGYYPARAALGKWNPDVPRMAFNNIGYANIVLKRQSNESAMPDFVQGNLTANMRYNIHNAFGTGRSVYYLPQLTDEDFNRDYKAYAFWDGRGYLRLEDSDEDGATIGVYTDKDFTKSARSGEKSRIATLNLEEGKSDLNDKVFMPGFNFCMGGMNVKLIDLENPQTRVRLRIDADTQEVNKGDKFLENACTVKNIRKQGINQYVEISCKEDKGKKSFTLGINPTVNLTIGGANNWKEYSVGQKLYETNNNADSVYLGFIGNSRASGTAQGLYIRLISIPKSKVGDSEKLSEDDLSYVASYDKNLGSYGSTPGFASESSEFFMKAYAHLGQFARGLITDKNVKSLTFADQEKEVFGDLVEINGYSGAYDLNLDSLPIEVKNNYTRAMEDYDAIKQSFASEKWPEGDAITLGEKASVEAIDLAYKIGQRKTALVLCQEHLENYKSVVPGQCEDELLMANKEISSQSVVVNGRTHLISFEGAKEPSFEEFGVQISVKTEQETKTYSLSFNEIIYLDDSTNEFIQLTDLEAEKATFRTGLKGTSVSTMVGQTAARPKTIELNKPETFGSKYLFSIDKINIKKVAKVELKPDVDYVKTNASFNFKIGIEKRGIKLSPEKTTEKIKSINETIEKLTKISDTLGKTVEAGKTICLVTTGALTFKNFLSNLDGRGIARQKVMRDKGGWYDKCQQMVNAGGYDGSMEKCLLENNDAIESSVSQVNDVINTQNQQLKDLADTIKKPDFLGENIADTDALMLKFIEGQFKNEINQCTSQGTVNVAGQDINRGEIDEKINLDTTSLSQARDLQLYCRLRASADGTTKTIAENNVDKILGEIYSNSQSDTGKKTFETESAGDFNNPVADAYAGKDQIEGIYRGTTTRAGNKYGIAAGTAVQLITYNNQKYVLELEGISSQGYAIKGVYEDSGTKLERTSETALGITRLFSQFKVFDANTYNNPYQEPVEARYYETEPYKGLPAVVPFDKKEGWYAAVKSTLPVLGGLRSYDASGRVSSFYVCNVGPGGREEAVGGNDICRGFVPKTDQSPKFPGLDDRKSEQLMEKAAKAIEDATRQYKPGVKTITINNQPIKVGAPAADIPDMQCEDFMSPSDCNIMFNVCDPFVCPSSRCDLGGTYPVKNVVQSGIIGSLALCMPNFPEVKIPICVSGVNAGVEGWNSVAKSYRDCLQTSLETGQTVGICDEINSVYMCEFMWRQTLPVAKYGISKVASSVGGSRGGGEYMSTENAFDNVEKSIDYFNQYYADDSYKAFKARSADQVGTELCRLSISASYPGQGDFLDALTAPDSPTQFYGRFEEIPFSTASNPPSSQYKVFYHIYAGKDLPAYYQVYLRGTGSSFYQDTSFQRPVASGFVPAGEFSTNTEDFTAPSGYKELCIVVNGQEECGFKEVTTDFFANSLAEQYVAREASRTDINSEAECVSGSPDSFNLLNPNMQAGVENTINPAIYNRGIIRVCSTENPGQGTDANANAESGRWKKVGTCGQASLGCWLDTSSVKDVIKNSDVEEQALGEVSQNFIEALEKEGDFINKNDFESLEKELEELDNDELAIKKIDSKIEKVFYNNQKAFLFLMRGLSYGNLARISFDMVREDKKEDAKEDKPEEEVETLPTGNACKQCGDGALNICDELECTKLGECTFEDGFVNTCRSATITETKSDDLTCTDQKSCKTVLGKEIIARAVGKKTNDEKFSDATIKAETGANSFECLILQVAWQETSIQHCNPFKDPVTNKIKGNPLYCEGDVSKTVSHDSRTGLGLMAINTAFERSDGKFLGHCGSYGLSSNQEECRKQLTDFEKNIEVGASYLSDLYDKQPFEFICTGKTYTGWNRALRSYNGPGCNGNNRYVEDVIANRDEVAGLFSQCGDSVSGTSV